MPFISREHGLRSKWKSACENLALEDVSSSRLDILTSAFWKANQSKPFIPTRSFLESLSKVLDSRRISPFSNLLPRQDLLALLIQLMCRSEPSSGRNPRICMVPTYSSSMVPTTKSTLVDYWTCLLSH